MRPPTQDSHPVGAQVRSSLVALTRRLFRIAGIEVHRRRPATNDPYRWLEYLQIDTILDIGANEGQFASQIRGVFPRAHIYSFEPLAEAHQRLVSTFRGDPNFTAIQAAIGNETAPTIIYRSSFSQSSSLLKMTNVHRDAYPLSAGTDEEHVMVRRLDELVADGTVVLHGSLLVKIDVQGFELQVLNGGRQTLARARTVIAEVCFAELYEGQPLFIDIWDAFRSLGFSLLCTMNVDTHPVTGRPLFADAVFTNE